MASRLNILFRLRTLGFEGRGTWEQGSSFAVSLVSSQVAQAHYESPEQHYPT